MIIKKQAVRKTGAGSVHTIAERYRRYGPAAEIYAEHFPENGLETLVREAWWEFDETGSLVYFRSESQLEDGTLYKVSRMDGTDLVYEDAQGVELDRFNGPLDGMTVATFKEAQLRAFDQVIAEHPEAPQVTIRGMELRVIEQRSPYESRNGPASPNSFSAPYLYDLQPVEKISRDYYSADAARGFLSEVWFADADGLETLVEYTDYVVQEILEN